MNHKAIYIIPGKELFCFSFLYLAFSIFSSEKERHFSIFSSEKERHFRFLVLKRMDIFYF